MTKIWLPDEERISVQWYTSDGKLTGVESVREEWLPRDIKPKPQAGFKDVSDRQ